LISELQREDQGSSSLSDHLLKALLPWSLHHRHAVRVPIQVMLSRVCQKDGNQDEFMQPIGQFLEANAEMNKMLSGSTKMALDASSIDASMSFLGLFSCLPNINCDGEDDLSGLEWPLHARDRLPLDLVSLVPALLKKLNRASYHRSAAGDNTSSALMPKSYEDANGVEVEEGEGEDEEDTSTFHQLRPTLDMGLNLQEEAADKAEALVKARSCTKGLVVVASLLHNLPNVAGLCRTCESMSCEALVVPSKVLVQSDEFLRQSVTSERWLRLLEVTPQDLPAFLAERKADGYTIVAVEQAQGSISLQHYSFPRQCVMVLGNEQNGVPSSILTLVDACVEIPMLGVTRSMNAHVTGAMCVWSYVQQHQLT
jgi:tRNA guanosine-2'-O-methyltransferase